MKKNYFRKKIVHPPLREVIVSVFFFFFLVGNLVAQESQRRVTGRVTDAQGELLVGVKIMVAGTSNGVVTNIDGAYTITVASSNSVLQFSYIGYEDEEVKVGNTNVIDIVMKESVNQLQEVVATAFGGRQKREDMVGSVTSIKTRDLKLSSGNFTTALAGQAAGIISYQRSGEPGQDDADFFIRGVTSFGTGKVNPLILIDGMELGTTELARLRPDDIESFSVFKDATSTALYGARGANGVIYVTTKQGKEGKPVVAFRVEGSLSAPTQNIEFADPITYMQLYNDAQLARDPFAVPFYSTEKIDRTREGNYPMAYPAVDWKDALFKDNTINQRYNASVSGGGAIARYYVAGSYSQDNGMLKVDPVSSFNNNVNLQSYTLRSNVNINLSKSSELIVRLNGNFDNFNGPIDGASEIYKQVVRSSPVDFLPYYPKDEEHQYVNHVLFGGLEGRSFNNPYAEMVKGYREYDRSLMMAQMEFKQNLDFLTEGLNFRIMFNTSRASRFDILRQYNPFFYQLANYNRQTGTYNLNPINENTGTEYLDFSVDGDTRQQSSILYGETALNYSRTFDEKHALSGMLVGIMRSEANAKVSSLQLSLPSRNLGISGRATYSYDSRYYGEFNFGYNGSERFDKTHRFGFFPSFGVAWSISNEAFWENIKPVINNLRLRYTYGLVGNDAIGSSTDRFFYLSNVNMSYADRRARFGRESNYYRDGISITRYANSDITWETSYKNNLAIEVGLFDKMNIMVDLFKERRTNILMSRQDIPETMGLTAAVRANIGEASGYGTDISADFSHSFSKDMWIQARGNFTFARTLYEVYEEPLYEKEWWLSRIGYPISQPWGYIAERLFVDDEDVANSPIQNFGVQNVAGDIKYKDVNGDGQISTLDRIPIGYPTTPEINYGFGISYGYKNFDISAFFQGSGRSSFWIGGTDTSGGTTTGPVNIQPFVDGKTVLKAIADSHYSLSNQDVYAFYPRLSTQNQANNMQLSTWWLRDGSFLRMKQFEVGYSLPKDIANKMLLSSFRMYVSGSNLFILSKFNLWDVEMGGNGLGYPLQRVFNVGLNLTF